MRTIIRKNGVLVEPCVVTKEDGRYRTAAAVRLLDGCLAWGVNKVRSGYSL